MRFEWDPEKDASNRTKHKIGFAQACELFESGADYLVIPDEMHSELEQRFISIGPIKAGLILVVWIERVEETIRLISARRANEREAKLYAKYMGVI